MNINTKKGDQTMKTFLLTLLILFSCALCFAGEEDILEILEHMKSGATLPSDEFSQLEADLTYERRMYGRSDGYDYDFDTKAMSAGFDYSWANLYWNSTLFGYSDYSDQKVDGDTKLNELYDIYDEIQSHGPSGSDSDGCFVLSL